MAALSVPLPAQENSPADGDGLTSEQHRIFDRLLERETRRDPEATALIEDDPAGAAALVESVEEGPAPAPVPPAPVTGTIFQPSRDWTGKSVEDWEETLSLARAAGIETLIVQWTDEGTVAYFQPAPENYEESHPLVNRILEAAGQVGLEVVLGLGNDPEYWRMIETRADVLDVYFRVRNTRNLRLQEALLENFGNNPNWTGYYLSEEIDDLNWREPDRERAFRQYLLRSGRLIRENDSRRDIAISSFFRKRTAPAIYAGNLRDLVGDTAIDSVWVQDGIGVELLSTPLIEPYYRELARAFAPPEPVAGVVVEIFEQTSAEGEPFAAQPALPARVGRQLQDASLVGGPLVLFSLLDYADPRKGGAQKEMYDLIVEWNSQFSAAESGPPAGDAVP